MIYLLIFAAIVGADVLTKLSAVRYLMKVDTVPLWEGVFHLTYVENRGAAFGILQNQRWFFVVLTMIVLAVVLVFCIKASTKHPLLFTGLSFMAGGAVGNLIDRVLYGYVVDFLDFRLIDFPVFNVADIFVVISAGLLALYFIFFDKTEEKDKDLNE